jgi:PKD repeat protein
MNKIKSFLVTCLIAGISIVGCQKDSNNPTAPARPDPIASFTYTGQTISPAAISFQNTSQNANKFLWDFGDGTTSTLLSPTKTYSAAGTFTIKLTATDSIAGKSSQASQQISILPGPIAAFSYTGQTVTGATITFQNSSLNANSYSWDFGDGTSSTAVNPTKTYSISSTYTVRLTATNTSYNRTDVASQQIQITFGSVFIDQVFVDNVPFVDSLGRRWDLLTGPYLYVTIADSVHSILYTTQSRYHADLKPTDLPVNWLVTPSYQILNWGKTLYIDLWDYNITHADTYMLRSQEFQINNIIKNKGYVTTLSLLRTVAGGTVQVRVILRWQ